MNKLLLLLLFCGLLLISACEKPVSVDTQKISLEINTLVKSCIKTVGEKVVKEQDVSQLDEAQTSAFSEHISKVVTNDLGACIQNEFSRITEKNVKVITKSSLRAKTSISATGIEVSVFYPVTIQTTEKFPTVIEINEFLEQFEPYGIYVELKGGNLLVKKPKTFLNVYRDNAIILSVQNDRTQTRTRSLKVSCRENCDLGKKILEEQELPWRVPPGGQDVYVGSLPINLMVYQGEMTVVYEILLQEANQTVESAMLSIGHSKK